MKMFCGALLVLTLLAGHGVVPWEVVALAALIGAGAMLLFAGAQEAINAALDEADRTGQ